MAVHHTGRLFGMEAEHGRWILVGAGCLINICLGSVYAYSVFRIPVQNLFQSTYTESGLPFTVFVAFSALMMLVGGRLMGRLGPKKIGIMGGVLVGVGWMLAGILPQTVPSIWTLALTYGAIGGSGVGLGYGATLAVANHWFPDKRGLALGLTIAGLGGSPVVSANVAGRLIEAHGPLYTFHAMGIAFLVIVVALSFLLRYPTAAWRPSGLRADATASAARLELEPGRMVKTSTFWGLFAGYTIGAMAGLMAISISSPVATEVIRIETATAAALVGVFALFNGASRPLWGWLTDRMTPRWTASISMLLIFSASLLMLGATEGTLVLYIVAFIAFWTCLGGWLAIAPTATATFFGSKIYAKNYGYVYIAYGVAAIPSNLVAGSSLDLFGSYDVAFMTTAALAAIGAIVALVFMKPPKHK